jgi:hypothetical protein
LNLLRRRHPQAQAAFDAVRLTNDPVAVGALLFGLAPTPSPAQTAPHAAAPARAGHITT